ncbi:NRAMP family divalent metal transporter [Arenivirga flava]|uniref:Membrane protein n=1 Tax=Arenivirga flava TaxID=1930060 RepID=A0AA37UFI4_9MICO|nr:NRAMP family divalent metal transporter [Arenivirga flava]GMA29493.1 membrane protein [Arenivirga flava]
MAEHDASVPSTTPDPADDSLTVAERTKAYARKRRSALIGAIFMMATSAIGPGFITQTATFTAQLGAAFAFGILVSVLIDFAIQLNVWRMVTITGMFAPHLANKAIPGAGYVLTVLIVVGGLAFNIGNIAGAGLGLQVLFGLDPNLGGAISAVIAIAIFLARKAGPIVDKVLIVLGLVMIALTVYVAVVSAPPVGDALRQTVLPDVLDFAAITTIVGGTVGGYITYSGAHKLLDSGTTGPENVREVNRAAMNGILVTGLMRYVLFLAVLGVVASGVALDTAGNPGAQAFQAAAGDIGFRVFGVVFWAAAITSVIGAAYTSSSFFAVFFRDIQQRGRNFITIGFIAVSLALFLVWGAAPRTSWSSWAASTASCCPSGWRSSCSSGGSARTCSAPTATRSGC